MLSYLPLWLFIIVMVSTPGPANMLLMAAGARHGFRPLLPFLGGLIAGKLALNIAIMLGLGSVLMVNEGLRLGFSIASAGYMSYLALQGWRGPKQTDDTPAIMGAKAGLIVHPLSPKSWVMATLAYSQFAATYEGVFGHYIIVPLSFVIAQLVFHSLWGLAGALVGQQLRQSLVMHRALVLVTLAVILWAVLQ